MKKMLLFLTFAIIIALTASCGTADSGSGDTVGETVASPETSDKTAETEETAPATEDSNAPKAEDYDYFHVFKAPEGNPRDIVYNYMYAMSQVKWVATESWATSWKTPGDFKVDLSYVKGKTYYGIPYSDTRATLDEFSMFVSDGSFTPNSPYYEELTGNNCSSAMDVSYNQILDFPWVCALRPTEARSDKLMFPEGIEAPPSRSSKPEDWISATLFQHNGMDAIYNGYAQLDKGDILYKMIDGSGHTRMVSKVEITKSAAGKLIPSRSYVYCIEQTNTWADSKKESTWFVDRKYTFTELYETLFMPVTFRIFHEANPTLEDAYIMMKGKNTPDTVKKLLSGVVESTFPLTYVRLTVTDSEGKTVSEAYENNMASTYKISLRNFNTKMGINKLPSGTYTFTLRAGIARGSVELENFQFTIG